MILIDSDGTAGRASPEDAMPPFLPMKPSEALAVETLLLRFAGSPGFAEALRCELSVCLWPGSRDALPLRGVVAAAARAIVSGWIRVGIEASYDAPVTFDAGRPTGHEMDGIEFAEQRTANGFIAALLRKPANLAAFEAALGHNAGRPFLGLVKLPEKGPARQRDLTALVTRMLLSRRLLLKPAELVGRRYRLEWVQPFSDMTAPGAGPAPAPPPPPPRVAPSSAPAASPNQLPPAAPSTSPQAAALIAAALAGLPFCAECPPAQNQAA